MEIFLAQWQGEFTGEHWTMFGFLRPKLAPREPFQVRNEVVIETPVEQVYALLDWSDPRNAYRERGDRIEAVEERSGCFRMRATVLPGHEFEIRVTEAVPNRSYGFTAIAKPQLGRMAKSQEAYGLETLGSGSCRLKLINTVFFVDSLRLKDLAHEQLMVSAATHNTLAKLKMQAERGVQALDAVADRWIV